MSLETIALLVSLSCAGVIVWDLVASLRAPAAGSTETGGAPPHAWLEIAYPLGFIAGMALLVLHSVMSFAAILLTATVLTGVIWAIDRVAFAKKRAKDSAEPVLVEMAKSFFPVILVVFLLRSFLVEPFKIPSGSMLPSLLIGDFILVNKYAYGVRLPVINQKVLEVGQPQRGEVMVFRYPEDPTKDFIKRIVGLPGDTVAYKNKRLTINGVPAPLESLGFHTRTDERLGYIRFESFKETFDRKPHSIMVRPEAPTLASMTRQFPNKKNCEYNFEGVVCKIPPGHFFMMGDNRDDSDDSRYWGFVPEENIVGKAFLVWMNFGNLARIGTRIE